MAIWQGKKDLTMATRYFIIFTHSNSPMPPSSPLEYCSLLFTDVFAEATCWVGGTCSYSTNQWLPTGTAALEAQVGGCADEHDGIDLCASGHMGYQGGAGVDWQSLWREFVVSSLKVFENRPIVKEWEQYLHFGVVGTIKFTYIKSFRTVMSHGAQYVFPCWQLWLNNSTLLIYPKEMTKYVQHFL